MIILLVAGSSAGRRRTKRAGLEDEPVTFPAPAAGVDETGNQEDMMFQALDVALAGVAAVRGVIDRIAQRDADLADQAQRAAQSVALNIAEGARRQGKDRPHCYRIAAGSSAEVTAAINIAIAWGYVTEDEAAPALGYFDRVRAMLWKLTH